MRFLLALLPLVAGCFSALPQEAASGPAGVDPWCETPVVLAVSDDLSEDCLADIGEAVDFWRKEGVTYLSVALVPADKLKFDAPVWGLVQVFGRELPLNVLARTRLSHAGSCISGAQIEIATCSPSTIGHEIGHALGLGHVEDRGNLMYYADTGQTGLESWQREAVAQ